MLARDLEIKPDRSVAQTFRDLLLLALQRHGRRFADSPLRGVPRPHLELALPATWAGTLWSHVFPGEALIGLADNRLERLRTARAMMKFAEEELGGTSEAREMAERAVRELEMGHILERGNHAGRATREGEEFS